ncbi:MAG: hypothetical protein QG612_1278, partial [Pseudomonadota bacterium]|nr:hypothetical protein [Pseudomonadota bacterium]
MNNIFHPSESRGWAGRLVALGTLGALGVAMPAQAAESLFQLLSSQMSCSNPIHATVSACLQAGAVVRYPNVVDSRYTLLKSDVLMWVDTTRSINAQPALLRSGVDATATSGLAVGEVSVPQVSGRSMVVFTFQFVEPGTTTPKTLPVPVFADSYDTDGGSASTPSAGIREYVEFMGAGQELSMGSNIERVSPSLAGGMGYTPILCTESVSESCKTYGIGKYSSIDGFSRSTTSQVSVKYAYGQSTLSVGFGTEYFSSGSGYESSRIYGIGLGIPDGWVDVIPVLSNLPPAVRPGQAYTGLTLTCHNHNGTSDATGVTCTPSASVGTVSNIRCTPALPTTLAPQAQAVCTFDYTAPGTQGGTDESTTEVVFTGITDASNDGRRDNNTTTATVQMIDAIDDGVSVTAGQAGSIKVLDNDTLGSGRATTSSVALSARGTPTAGASFDASTGVFSVPAEAAAGTYTLNYQICSVPAAADPICDTATATILVGAAPAPDLTISKTHTPGVLRVGEIGRYTLSVRNAGALPTSGLYTVIDTLPAGMTVAALPTGSGWDCSATTLQTATAQCSRSTVLAIGASAPEITLDVNVPDSACAASDASGRCTVTNIAKVSGGGETTPESLKNNTATDDTTLQKVGALSGRVWIDADHDLQQGGSEPGVAGVWVEALDASGTVVGTATTDANGDYALKSLPVGSYTVRFSDAASRAYYGRPVSRDPSGGNDPSADASTGRVAAKVLSGVSVTSGVTRVQQSLPLDPSGLVYDSVSRSVLGGVGLELLDASGQAVAGGCLVGGSNRVTTTASGALAGYYSFLLNNPVPSGCPGAGVYQLRITPSAGYAASTLIPAQSTTLVPPTGCAAGSTSAQCLVQAQATAPTGSAPTTHYLSIRLDPVNGPDVLNNHIPLDPAGSSGLLVIKTGDRTQAELGDSVRYTITVRRTDTAGATLPAVEIIDTLPAGFRYIAGTAMVGGVTIADPSGAPGPV